MNRTRVAGKKKNGKNIEVQLRHGQKPVKVATWQTLWGKAAPTPKAWKIFAIFHQLKTDFAQFSMPYATCS